jgi:hypothetical protein
MRSVEEIHEEVLALRYERAAIRVKNRIAERLLKENPVPDMQCDIDTEIEKLEVELLEAGNKAAQG